MEFFFLWLGINALIGYALGKPKNEVGASILVCILLGPIGWLLCILNKGKLRKCPYCAESVKPEASVCRYCGREIGKVPVEQSGSRPMNWRRAAFLIFGGVCVVAAIVCINNGWNAEQRKINRGYVVLVKSASFGNATPQPGEKLTLDYRTKDTVRVVYGGINYDIPVSWTDLRPQP